MVTDDIVTRLREYEAITDNAYVINALVAAADEIERLRADVKRWSNWAIDYACDDMKCECDRCTDVRTAWNGNR